MPKIKADQDDMSILEIDIDSLDEEWVGQSPLYFRYAKKLADARDRLERRKTELDLVYAECDRDIRKNPKKYKLAKISETAIKSAIYEHPEYREIQDIVHKAKHRVDVLGAAVQALEHRKRALENLVELHGQSYFATPVAKGEAKEAVEQAAKKSVRKRGQYKRDNDD